MDDEVTEADVKAFIDADIDHEYLIMRVRKGLLTPHEMFIMRECAKTVGLVIAGHKLEPLTLTGKANGDLRFDSEQRVDKMVFKITLTAGYDVPESAEADTP